MLKASGAMAAATLTSRVLGMVREMVYMSFMGTGWVNDAFQYAFTIPNLFRRLLGEGALTAAFIPVFKEKERNHGEAEMWRAANAVLSGLVVAACVIVAVALLVISLALSFGAPHTMETAPMATGLSQTVLPTLTHAPAITNAVLSPPEAGHFWTPGHFSPKIVLMLQLLRLMFPYMIFVCLTAVMMGMLNSRGHFFIPAMGATTLNIVMIASVWWLAPKFGVGLPKEQKLPVQIFALAYGVLAAGVAQAAFQVPTLWRDGFRYRWVSPWRDATVQRVVRQMIPGTIGVAAFQINVAMVQGVALFVGTGIVSQFNGAVRLMELPQGMFGISLATYLLPTLAGLAADKNYPEFRTTLRHGLSTLLFLNLIACALLFTLAEPIVRLLFEHGEFTAFSTRHVSYALECLAPGLVMFSTVNILARAFYALGDTKTPMKISLVCLVINFTTACILLVPLREGGPGIANTITSCINAGLLLFTLRKKLARLDMEPLKVILPKLLLITVISGLIAWISWLGWEKYLGHETIALKIGAVFVPAGIAGGVYLLAALACKIPAANELTEFALAKLKRKIKS
jgi:putative peptidoglycan lipid II flippase